MPALTEWAIDRKERSMLLSPLDSVHRAANAKIVPFGGWDMPVSYPTGTLDEHRLCRTDAVVFDVSHLGTVRITGPGAFGALQRTLTNDLAKVSVGRAQYTHLLDPEDASIVDDIIVWWVEDEVFDVMPNASNTDTVIQSLRDNATGEVTVEDTTKTRGAIAVQGPNARAKLQAAGLNGVDVGRFRVQPFEFNGFTGHIAGTGYTGEDGVEITIERDGAEQLWNTVVGAGITPAGLGARDTLRLEAGLPLHGNELGPGVSPLHVNLGWVVGWDKPTFIGKEAVTKLKEAGVDRVLRGLQVEGRRPPRAGQDVVVDSNVVGTVTSGNYSPNLGTGIALAFIDPSLDESTELGIDVRGTIIPARIVDVPFYTSSS